MENSTPASGSDIGSGSTITYHLLADTPGGTVTGAVARIVLTDNVNGALVAKSTLTTGDADSGILVGRWRHRDVDPGAPDRHPQSATFTVTIARGRTGRGPRPRRSMAAVTHRARHPRHARSP